MTTVVPVILCGGSGTRLWPLSRSGFPKQFLVLSGNDSGKSLFQEAVERLNQLPGVDLGGTLIVTNEEHRFLVLDQLREMPGIRGSLFDIWARWRHRRLDWFKHVQLNGIETADRFRIEEEFTLNPFLVPKLKNKYKPPNMAYPK